MASRAMPAALLLIVAALVLCACSSAAADERISASILVEPSPGDARWFRDVTVDVGTDGYELLGAATAGQFEADWFPQLRSHFVTSLLGTPSEGSRFWLTFVWDEPSGAWQPLPTGADFFSVKDGHVFGWALLDTSSGAAQLPASQP
jgi:hypothetical protein